MDIIESIVKFLINLLNKLLPKIGISDGFFETADSVMSAFITIVEWAGWFLPLDLFLLCMTTILIVDNFALLSRVVQWIIRLIRG